MSLTKKIYNFAYNLGYKHGLYVGQLFKEDEYEAGFDEGYTLALEENRYEGYQYDNLYEGVELRYKVMTLDDY